VAPVSGATPLTTAWRRRLKQHYGGET